MYRDTPIGGLRAFANSNSTAARDMLDPPTPLLPEKPPLAKEAPPLYCQRCPEMHSCRDCNAPATEQLSVHDHKSEWADHNVYMMDETHAEAHVWLFPVMICDMRSPTPATHVSRQPQELHTCWGACAWLGRIPQRPPAMNRHNPETPRLRSLASRWKISTCCAPTAHAAHLLQKAPCIMHCR